MKSLQNIHLLFFSLFIKSWKSWLPMSTVHSVCRTIGPPSTLEKIIRKKRAENKWQICEWWDEIMMENMLFLQTIEECSPDRIYGFASILSSYLISSLFSSSFSFAHFLFSNLLSFLLLSPPLLSSLLFFPLFSYLPLYCTIPFINSQLHLTRSYQLLVVLVSTKIRLPVQSQGVPCILISISLRWSLPDEPFQKI